MNYDFDLQVNLSSIYHYGYSSVMKDDNQEYWNNMLNKAIAILGAGWRVNYETYKGASKKYKGWATVTIIADGGQEYGFRHPQAEAEEIHKVIHAVWIKVIHGDFTGGAA